MLEVLDVSAGYATGTVLRGVSLTVAEGELLALLGRNGMGKTTLLRAIAGLRPPVLTRGSIRVAGEEVSTLPSYQVARRGVSLVPQGRRVFGSLTVEENLRIVARPNRGWDLARVYDLFPRLVERRQQHGATLSGGEQQMLATARALMFEAKLLAIDEPSLGLAPRIREELFAAIGKIHAEGVPVLLVEQEVGQVFRMAKRSYVLSQGRIIAEGTAQSLMADETLRAGYLGL
jgi:branched-chain amino acid transport system ATP-binding protein